MATHNPGPLFRAKTRALEKHLQKSFPLHTLELTYPTGPLPLDPADIPGFSSENGSQGHEEQKEPENFAWWRRSNTADPVEYKGLDDGLSAVAQILNEQGPFDGVMGFSQGAAGAAMITSLLEPSRKESFEYFSDPANNSAPSIFPPTPGATVTGIPFPESFTNVTHPPFKFAVCYSGFRSPGPRYRAFYERPGIQTPVLHVLGTLDAIVDEGRSKSLIDACEAGKAKDERVAFHPGGHFLPSQRPYLDAVVRFVKGSLDSEQSLNGVKAKEESVEDMDMPF